jgi:hypothetical protein
MDMADNAQDVHISDLKEEKKRHASVPRSIKKRPNLLENLSVREMALDG